MIAVRRPSLVLCVSGTTAVEFAIILPALVMLLLGTLSASLAIYTAASMHYAVEAAARWYSVNDSPPGNVTTTQTQTHAQNNYLGLGSPTFTASSAGTCAFCPAGSATACGHQVNATLSVVLNAGVKQNLTPAQWTIPLSATACFP
jgi:Flp pilus assembly protein TadG